MAGTYLQKIAVSTATSGDNTLVAAPANIGGQAARIRVVAFVLQGGGTVNVTFYSGSSATGTALTGAMALSSAGNPIAAQPMPQTPHGIEGHFDTNPGDKLNLNLSGNVQVSGWLVYTVIAA